MTVDTCVSQCANRGYTLAGAEYANECYCGNAYAGTDTGGGSVAPESECNTACVGDSSQACGGGNRLSVYVNTQVPPGTPALPSGWSSTTKCITEASTGRALVGNSLTSQSLTLDQCVDLCDQTGFQYAGAEVCHIHSTLDSGLKGFSVWCRMLLLQLNFYCQWWWRRSPVF